MLFLFKPGEEAFSNELGKDFKNSSVLRKRLHVRLVLNLQRGRSSPHSRWVTLQPTWHAWCGEISRDTLATFPVVLICRGYSSGSPSYSWEVQLFGSQLGLISNCPSSLPYNIGNSFEKILNTEGVHWWQEGVWTKRASQACSSF